MLERRVLVVQLLKVVGPDRKVKHRAGRSAAKPFGDGAVLGTAAARIPFDSERHGPSVGDEQDQEKDEHDRPQAGPDARQHDADAAAGHHRETRP